MAIEYLDFELEMGAGPPDGSWPLSVIQSPAGNARGALGLPAAPDKLALQAQQLAAREIMAFGTQLFDALFPAGSVRDAYTESLGVADARDRAVRLKLRIVDPALAAVPWELIYDQRLGEFSALLYDTAIVRYVETAQPVKPLAITPPLRILGMAVDPTHKLDLAAEKGAVAAALDDLIQRKLVELVWLEGGTWRDLQRSLRPDQGPWHVFHFVGHGGFDPTAQEGFLILADDQGEPEALAGQELGRLLARHSPLRLAFLNACHGAVSAPADLTTGIAGALVRRGVPAVIAMQFALQDNTGIELGRTFYEALAGGLPVEAALTEARIAVSLAQRAALDWAAPVLYLRTPDGLLFELAVTARRQSAPPNITRLTGTQFGQLHKALLSAFKGATLRMMVRTGLDEDLDAIAGGSDQSAVVFNLIDWAQRTGRLSALIQAA
ncbi:MAG: CHAT domain-containing protein, partial [Caldilineaceae bacterium]|nr:CHAT domain-containing protein [Caldilineaceae bacterium]